MSRLNTERQKELEPQRMEYAKKQLQSIGIQIEIESKTYIEFKFKGEKVRIYVYSGWFTGKKVKDGRGIYNLINQIK